MSSAGSEVMVAVAAVPGLAGGAAAAAVIAAPFAAAGAVAVLTARAAMAGADGITGRLGQLGDVIEGQHRMYLDTQRAAWLWQLAVAEVVDRNAHIAALTATARSLRGAVPGPGFPIPLPLEVSGRNLAEIHAWCQRADERLARVAAGLTGLDPEAPAAGDARFAARLLQGIGPQRGSRVLTARRRAVASDLAAAVAGDRALDTDLIGKAHQELRQVEAAGLRQYLREPQPAWSAPAAGRPLSAS